MFSRSNEGKSLPRHRCFVSSCGVSLDTWFEPLDEEFYEVKCEDEDKPVLLLFTEYYNFKDNVTLLNRFRDRYKKPGMWSYYSCYKSIHETWLCETVVAI